MTDTCCLQPSMPNPLAIPKNNELILGTSISNVEYKAPATIHVWFLLSLSIHRLWHRDYLEVFSCLCSTPSGKSRGWSTIFLRMMCLSFAKLAQHVHVLACVCKVQTNAFTMSKTNHDPIMILSSGPPVIIWIEPQHDKSTSLCCHPHQSCWPKTFFMTFRWT